MTPRRASKAPESGSEPDVAAVAEGVQRLAEEVAAVREVLDAIREDVQWAVRNPERARWTTAMDDDDEVITEDAELGQRAPSRRPERGQRRILVDAEQFAQAMDGVEQLVYCCEAPDLRWTGDPEHPGVACAECGYVVAENGEVVDYVTRGADHPPAASDRAPSLQEPFPATAPEPLPNPQGELF